MNETDYNEKTCFDSAKILYNYPRKGKWIAVVYIPSAMKRAWGGAGGGGVLVFTKSFW